MPQKDTDLRTHLTAAAARLREVGSNDLAQYVDTVLAPGGWRQLSETGGATWPIRMPLALRTAIQTQAEAAGNVLSDDVREGLAEFIAGRFTPERLPRARRGTAAESVNLTVRVSSELRASADKAGAERADELGYTAKASQVATAWLMQKYGISVPTA
ncbi:hypothetical protein ACF06X_33455 [Streptomyces sp. NPDC015346]|uniref:hypothetical protein n=1 Tax=Streptomyces sp. NPDC015346 TaxID=3364954 RepID=UPI0037029614